MYFADFQSFMQTQESSKSFIVEVDLVDGGTEIGSPVPKDCYAQLMADIAVCDELKTAFALWRRDGTKSGTLNFIPYDKIKLVRVRFVS